MQGTLLKEIDIKVDKTTNKFKVANKQMKQLLEEVHERKSNDLFVSSLDPAYTSGCFAHQPPIARPICRSQC